jgi:hypothetical protein
VVALVSREGGFVVLTAVGLRRLCWLFNECCVSSSGVDRDERSTSNFPLHVDLLRVDALLQMVLMESIVVIPSQ